MAIALWGCELALAFWALRVAQFFVYRMGRIVREPLAPVDVPVAVILPVKGVDASTQANIEKLLNQDYPTARFIFAVESVNDPVHAIIETLMNQNPSRRITLVVAGQATHRSQKVHNQLAAIDQTTSDDRFLAFMDADAAPGPHWLHALVIPLTYPHIAATTGYRFYVPEVATNANAMLSVMNAIIAGMLGPHRRTVAWGGSMAISREKFFSLGIYEAWQHALSDDYVLSYQVKKQGGQRIHFVPQCMVASPAQTSWAKLFEFATRQYRITRRCAARLWFTGVLGAAAYLLTLASSFYFAVWPDKDFSMAWGAYIPGVVFVFVLVLSMLRGWFLLRAGKLLLPDHAGALAACAKWFTFLFPAVQAFNLFCLLAAGFGDTITWRGIRYQMVNRRETRIVPPLREPRQD